MRGSTTLFKDIFDPPAKPVDNSSSLRSQKIACMIDWYYFRGRATRRSYEDLLDDMEPVFFIASITIHDIFQKNREQLLNVKRQWKNEEDIDKIKNHFKKKWPNLVWAA